MKKIKLLLMCAVVATPSIFAIGADASIKSDGNVKNTEFQEKFSIAKEVSVNLELPDLG